MIYRHAWYFVLVATLCATPAIALELWRSSKTLVVDDARGSYNLPVIYTILRPPSVQDEPQLDIAGDASRHDKIRRIFKRYCSLRQRISESMHLVGTFSGQQLLGFFKPGKKYTYIITKEKLFFARIRRGPRLSYLTKHYFVSDYTSPVVYAGECWLSEHRRLVIDNNSGTFQSPASRLEFVRHSMQQLLGLRVDSQVFYFNGR